MRYCLNPRCVDPRNPDDARFCQNCGSKISLADCYYAFQPLGQGQATRTFLAIDECKPSQPKCIIKQFSPQSGSGINFQEATELFRREATRLDELGDHPQIPRLIAHFEEKERLCLVQQYIEGENLAQEAATSGAFDQAKIEDLLRQMLPVLRYIHNRRIIHRDIKPENIIRRSLGNQSSQLVLVDFGAAKLTVSPISGAAARSGTVIGSARYAAPEQTLGKATYASDIYSLGLTCLNLITLVDPFDLYSDLENKWVWRDYLPSSSAITPGLSKILDRMVATTLNKRYQSVGEVIKDLDRLQGINAPSTKSAPAIPVTEQEPSVNWDLGQKASPSSSGSQPSIHIPHIPDISSSSTWHGNQKSRAIAIILAFFGGWVGLHKFYLGQTGWGIAYFMFSWTYIPALLGIAEGIYLINIS
jgi:serine/threonine protein kinase